MTQFSPVHSQITGGKAVLGAARVPGTNRVYTGVITSKGTVKYPVFLEANIKVNGLVLSSNFWLLSRNDRTELDVVETYGSGKSAFFEGRMNSNYHVFVRDPNTNAITQNYNEQQGHYLAGNEPLRNGYHRFGMYWKDAFTVEWYLDGRKVRTLTRSGITDPTGRGLDEEMPIILDVEDHDWRSDQGIVVSDAELADNSINKMFVDWVRVYKPVASSAAVNPPMPKLQPVAPADVTPPPSGYAALTMRHSGKCLDVTDGSQANGERIQQWSCNNSVNRLFRLEDRGDGWWGIRAQASDKCLDVTEGSLTNGAPIQQWTCNAANPNQSFRKLDRGAGWFSLQSRRSSLCVDVLGASEGDAATLGQWVCNTKGNQQMRYR